MQSPAPPPEPSAAGPTKDTATEALSHKAAETYRWWNNLATIHPEDPLLVGVAKIGFRLLGILVLLALSPVILLGLIIAFFAVL